jgi:hypothetical protein
MRLPISVGLKERFTVVENPSLVAMEEAYQNCILGAVEPDKISCSPLTMRYAESFLRLRWQENHKTRFEFKFGYNAATFQEDLTLPSGLLHFYNSKYDEIHFHTFLLIQEWIVWRRYNPQKTDTSRMIGWDHYPNANI